MVIEEKSKTGGALRGQQIKNLKLQKSSNQHESAPRVTVDTSNELRRPHNDSNVKVQRPSKNLGSMSPSGPRPAQNVNGVFGG